MAHNINNSVTNEVFRNEDMFRNILDHSEGEGKTLVSLSCVNKELSNQVPKIVSNFSLGKVASFCGRKFRMITEDNSIPFFNFTPPLKKFELIAACQMMGPHVEGDEGVSYYRVKAGTTFSKIRKTAKDAGINIKTPSTLELRDCPVQQPYGVLQTNNVVKNSQNKGYEEQKALVKKFGCELPRINEAIPLVVLTKRDFQLKPLTATHCFERVNTCPLKIDNSSSSLDINCSPTKNFFNIDFPGTVARRKL